jgi:sigma-B regulation protein RsbQ
VEGSGAGTIVFAHGFGCDQSMWRLMTPHYARRYRTLRYDLAGSGRSDPSAYDLTRHASLRGHAEELLEILGEFAERPVVFVGHSVSAMIGLLAGVSAPRAIDAQVMVGPSPCYTDDGGYVGGFSRDEIEAMLRTLRCDYLGWSGTMAPMIMGAPEHPGFAEELTRSFCRTDPDIAAHFARVTFLSDNRADVAELRAPTLVLQCSDDIIAPLDVAHYLQRTLPNATLRIIENVGHCPHLTAPGASMAAMDALLESVESARAGG